VNVGELELAGLTTLLRQEGLGLDFGAARARVRTDLPSLAATVHSVYRHFPVEESRGFFDVTATVRHVRGLRRYVRPQIEFVADGEVPFEPFSSANDLPLLEWGLNWHLGERCNRHLLLHAGVVERGGVAVILPALPGSGKSTLTAALMVSGYRLLSDEFGVVRLDDGLVVPMLRPISLKNESIDVIRGLDSRTALGPIFRATRKGDVAHLGPNAESVAGRQVLAEARFLIFPRFEVGVATRLEPIPRARAFAKLAVNSFNYEILGPAAFEAVGQLIGGCSCYRLGYGNLAEAIFAIGELLQCPPEKGSAERSETGGLFGAA